MNGRTVVNIRMDGFQRDIELPEGPPSPDALRAAFGASETGRCEAISHDGRDRVGCGQHADADRQRIAERLRYLERDISGYRPH